MRWLSNTSLGVLAINTVLPCYSFISWLWLISFSTAQRRIRAARNSLKDVPFHDLKTDNYDDGKEYEFWEGLRNACLLPESQIFGGVAELKEKLAGSSMICFNLQNT